MTLVSVLLPAYNAGSYLSGAVASILAQSHWDIELLLLNDGSTDGSIEELQSEVRDPRLRIITNRNQGLARTLNVGLSLAQGKLVARMDADDWSDPKRLEHQVAAFALDRDLVLLGTQIRRLVSGTPTSTSVLPSGHGTIVKGLLRGEHVICHPTVMFRKDAAQAVGGYWDHGVSEDWDFYLKMSQKGRIANLPGTFLDYRFHSSGINASSIRQVRSNIRLAVVNYRLREEGRAELNPEDFARTANFLEKTRIFMESRSLTYYRQALLLGDDDRFRKLFLYAAAGLHWPSQAMRRVSTGRSA